MYHPRVDVLVNIQKRVPSNALYCHHSCGLRTFAERMDLSTRMAFLMNLVMSTFAEKKLSYDEF